jgi:two-component system, cell cycle response regulator DivK
MLRCLIVEDHGDTRAGYAEYLEVCGIQAWTAADAEELRQILSKDLPDAIVLDLQLPRTDGWQLMRELKGDERTRLIPIVVVSACVMPAERAAAEEAGCDAFLMKPVDPAEIVEAIHRCIGIARG